MAKQLDKDAEYPNPQQMVEVFGLSMWPYLRSGDLLLCEDSVQDMNYKTGDIVGFTTGRDRTFSYHRVVKSSPTIVKGDFERRTDNSLYGEVTCQQRALYRLKKKGHNLRKVPLQKRSLGWLRRLIAFFSGMTQTLSNPFFQIFFLIPLVFLGFTLRRLEELLSLGEPKLKSLK